MHISSETKLHFFNALFHFFLTLECSETNLTAGLHITELLGNNADEHTAPIRPHHRPVAITTGMCNTTTEISGSAGSALRPSTARIHIYSAYDVKSRTSLARNVPSVRFGPLRQCTATTNTRTCDAKHFIILYAHFDQLSLNLGILPVAHPLTLATGRVHICRVCGDADTAQ